MGRPIKKSHFGTVSSGGTGNIEVYSYRFTGEDEVLSSTKSAWIVKQKSSNKFLVSDGTITEILTIGGTPTSLSEGQMSLRGYDDDGSWNEVMKLYNRVAQVVDSSVRSKKKWSVGTDIESDSSTEIVIPAT